MNPPDISKADFSALLELAESRFDAWHRRELRPERDRRLSELQKQNLTSGGRAVFAMRTYRALLEREVRERIGFYSAVAHESGNPEMLSKPRLEEYRDLIMISVKHAIGALMDQIERDATAAGDILKSVLPDQHRYVQLRAEILDVVNAELRVLEAEWKLAGRAETNVEMSQAFTIARLPEDARAPLDAPAATFKAGWEAVEILFLSDDRVQIWSGGKTETRNYADFGFADRRDGKPNQAWLTLRVLAQERGMIRDGAKTGREWPKVEKRIQEIRKLLRKHFAIAADPLPFVEGTGYCARFQIRCAPSFET